MSLARVVARALRVASSKMPFLSHDNATTSALSGACRRQGRTTRARSGGAGRTRTRATLANANERSTIEGDDVDFNAIAFRDAGLANEELIRALERMEITTPTEIQAKALVAVRRGGNVFIASHTGSGKTLAYLLPVIQRLKEDENAAGERLAKPRRPKVIVTCPTRELAEQVAEVAKEVSHIAKFSSYLVIGGKSLGTQKERLDSPIDVIIGTPGRLVKHVEQGNLFLGSVDALILDEADTLFEAGFGDDVKRMLRPLKARPEGKTCVLVSATMPERLKKLVDDELPNMQYVKTESLHRSAPNLKHRFVDCPGDVDKMKVLEQIVVPEHGQGKKVMIFCNTMPSCIAVERTMFEANIRTVQYHGDMTSDSRAESMRDFIDANSADNLTMVCTDLAARGLDFGRVKVDHVINFDFPMNPIDYIHRSGRTARAGAGGKVTNLVTKKDRVLAGEIDTAVKLGLPIDNATSSRAISEARKKKTAEEVRFKRTGGASRAKPVTAKTAPKSNRGRRGASRFEDTSSKPANAKYAKPSPRSPRAR